jgi:hypothetical protein
MPDASPHCKRPAAELNGVLSEKLTAKDDGAKATDAPGALLKIKAGSGPLR